MGTYLDLSVFFDPSRTRMKDRVSSAVESSRVFVHGVREGQDEWAKELPFVRVGGPRDTRLSPPTVRVDITDTLVSVAVQAKPRFAVAAPDAHASVGAFAYLAYFRDVSSLALDLERSARYLEVNRCYFSAHPTQAGPTDWFREGAAAVNRISQSKFETALERYGNFLPLAEGWLIRSCWTWMNEGGLRGFYRILFEELAAARTTVWFDTAPAEQTTLTQRVRAQQLSAALPSSDYVSILIDLPGESSLKESVQTLADLAETNYSVHQHTGERTRWDPPEENFDYSYPPLPRSPHWPLTDAKDWTTTDQLPLNMGTHYRSWSLHFPAPEAPQAFAQSMELRIHGFRFCRRIGIEEEAPDHEALLEELVVELAEYLTPRQIWVRLGERPPKLEGCTFVWIADHVPLPSPLAEREPASAANGSYFFTDALDPWWSRLQSEADKFDRA